MPKNLALKISGCWMMCDDNVFFFQDVVMGGFLNTMNSTVNSVNSLMFCHDPLEDAGKFIGI